MTMNTLNLYLIITMLCTLGGLNAVKEKDEDNNTRPVMTRKRSQSDPSPTASPSRKISGGSSSKSPQTPSKSSSEEHSEKRKKVLSKSLGKVLETAITFKKAQESAEHEVSLINQLFRSSYEEFIEEKNNEFIAKKLMKATPTNFVIIMNELVKMLKYNREYFIQAIWALEAFFKKFEGTNKGIPLVHCQQALENFVENVYSIYKKTYLKDGECRAEATGFVENFPKFIRHHYPPELGREKLNKYSKFNALFNNLTCNR